MAAGSGRQLTVVGSTMYRNQLNSVQIEVLLSASIVIAAYYFIQRRSQNDQTKSLLVSCSLLKKVKNGFKLATGKCFSQNIIYAQKISKEKDTISEIPGRILEDNILQKKNKFCHMKFSKYVETSKSNIEILKAGFKSTIRKVYVYSNPLPSAAIFNSFNLRKILRLPNLPSIRNITIHAFVVFETYDSVSGKEMWWSLEKNGHNFVLQHSTNKSDVVDQIYDIQKKDFVKRLGPVKELAGAASSSRLSHLFTIICETRLFSTNYHLLKANCQHFASFVFEIANYEGKKWSNLINYFKHYIQTDCLGADTNAIRHYWILKSNKHDLYMSLIEKKEFSEIEHLMEKHEINEKDLQGYTLLEWAEAFSRDDVKNCLEKKGAVQSELHNRNVFFIALQYLDSNDELNDPKLSFEGIDMTGVNQTGDMALPLALYGGKWKIAKKMLKNFTNIDLNAFNSLNESPIHLAAKLESCPISIFKILSNQMNPEKINMVDHFEYAPLHYTVDVRSPNMKKIKLLLARGADINCQSKKGFTALHFALFHKLTTAAIELLKQDADVNIMDKSQRNALLYASWWSDVPAYVFKRILWKTTDVNWQDKLGRTALLAALLRKNKVATEQLLKYCKTRPDGTVERVNVNIRNKCHETALHWAAAWPTIPHKLFQSIFNLNFENINAKDEEGNYPLDFAVKYKSKTGIDFLLAQK